MVGWHEGSREEHGEADQEGECTGVPSEVWGNLGPWLSGSGACKLGKTEMEL